MTFPFGLGLPSRKDGRGTRDGDIRSYWRFWFSDFRCGSIQKFEGAGRGGLCARAAWLVRPVALRSDVAPCRFLSQSATR